MASELLASRRRRAVDTVLPELKRRLELVGLPDDVLERFPIELSGGMKQRVVMVLSSLLDPSLLIADEVTSALDVSTQRAVAELLVEFRDRGFVKSMIVITHDLSVLYQIADTILVMYAGKLAEKAPADDDRRRRRGTRTRSCCSRRCPRSGVRYAEQRLTGHPGPAAVAARPAGRLPLQGALPARVREVRGGAAVRRSSSPGTPPRAGRRRLMLEVDTCCKAYRVGAFGGERAARRPRRQLRASSPGEVVSLIGESGSGKSTIGKMILRLLRDDARRDHVRRRRHLDARGPAAEGVLRRRAGRLPGSVQLVQPDLQGRPRLHDAPQRVLLRA